ncbi:GntR family transcriptional regulator [Streptomyces humidus]|uniref:GntR family transcriptional regulator n=1 Tax=Streptomyces humidus TaxID=52259 RepID=A0A918G1G6_9ACTN|nr:GntR family transcriptional regulator [Streptomyces humidus]GGS13193.1 GntR family transcriptional regulator [Streptomyces humidus]
MKPLRGDPRDTRPLGVRVYERLRDEIVSGGLEADSPLVQEQLAERLGVSRTPLRDALNRLAHEDLVTWVPGSGYIVNALKPSDISEVYQVRQSLETLALRLACGRHDRAQLARLLALIEDMAASDPVDAVAQFELNRAFHMSLIEPCGNALLLRMIDTLWDHPVNRRITRSYVDDAANVPLMTSEHRAIFEAARAGDEERLVRLATEHMYAGYQETLPEGSEIELRPRPGSDGLR